MFGGFTWSGGEPLLQDRFAVRFFRAAKSEKSGTEFNMIFNRNLLLPEYKGAN